MMEDELIKIWQSSPEQEQIKFEKSRLMLDMESSINRIHRSWKYMLIRESLAGAIGIPILAHIAYTHPFKLTRIGAVLIILSTIYIFFRLLSVARQKPNNYSETYLDYLYKAREVLSIQKKSVDNVIYWYMLPLYPGLIFMLWGFAHIPEKLKWILLAISSIIGITIGVHFLNKWASKKQFTTRLQKIDELIEVMEE